MSFRRLLLFLHFMAGAVSGAFLLILSITGSVLVFEPEIDHWLNRRLVTVTPGEHRLSLGELAAAAEQRHPGTRLSGISFSSSDRLAYSLNLRGPHGSSVFVDPFTGAELGSKAEASVFMGKVHQFHTNLLLGPTGKTITLIAVLFLLFLTLSGVILWARRKVWRWRGSGQRPSFTVHNLVGIYSSVFMVLFAVTGVVIHWDGEIVQYLRGLEAHPAPTQDSVHPASAPGPPLGPDAAYARATGAMPGARPVVMLNLGGTTEPIRVLMKYPEDRTPAGRTIVLLHPVTGEVLWAQSSRVGPLGVRIVKLWNREIHTGDLWGWPTRILASVASLGLAVLVVTGPFLWLARHRRKVALVIFARPG